MRFSREEMVFYRLKVRSNTTDVVEDYEEKLSGMSRHKLGSIQE